MATGFSMTLIEDEEEEDDSDAVVRVIMMQEENEEDEDVDSGTSHSWLTSGNPSWRDGIWMSLFEIGCVFGSAIFIVLTIIFASNFVLLYTGFALLATSGACGMAGLVRNVRNCHVAAAVIAVVAFLDFAAVLAFSVASYFLTNVVMNTYHSKVWEHTNKFGFVFLGVLFLVWLGASIVLLVKHALHSINIDKVAKKEDSIELVEDPMVSIL